MKIAISWNELPKYAAYAISEIIKKNPEVEIISIKSKLPIHNLEKIIKKKIHWVENKNLNWKDLNFLIMIWILFLIRAKLVQQKNIPPV
jgi:hypothetical protein